MIKNFLLIFLLVSCASMFTTSSDLHLFYGGDKDYFKYDSMKKETIVQFYTTLLKNNLTYNVSNQMQANEVFRKVKLKEFSKFEEDKELKGVTVLIKFFHHYYSKKDYKDILPLIKKEKLTFAIARLNETFKQAVEKKGYWSKKYYLNILGRISEAPQINYKVFASGFQDLYAKKLISKEDLREVGQNFINGSQKDKYMGFDVTDRVFGYNLQLMTYKKCKSSACKKIKKEKEYVANESKREAQKKDVALNKFNKFLEKNAQLLKNEKAFFKELETKPEFAQEYYDLVTPLWFAD